MILTLAIAVFIILELSNIVILYFKPEFKYGNSMAAFEPWDSSQGDEVQKLFTRYLVNWVANCKLIFVVLLAVIAVWGDETLKVGAVAATIISIGIYFVSLHPLIKKLDVLGKIRPAGYSRTLGLTIAGFMAMFAVALAVHFGLKG